LLGSTDWGDSWTTLQRQTMAATLSFANPRDGWATQLVAPKRFYGLIATSDGGRHWHDIANPCGSLPVGGGSPHLASLVTPHTGWVVCDGETSHESQVKAIAATLHAGATWKISQQSWGGIDRGIAFDRRGNGWYWFLSAPGLRTTDFGDHWRPWEFADGERELLSVAFPEPGTGYAVVPSKLLFSSDAGTNWRTVLKVAAP